MVCFFASCAVSITPRPQPLYLAHSPAKWSRHCLQALCQTLAVPGSHGIGTELRTHASRPQPTCVANVCRAKGGTWLTLAVIRFITEKQALDMTFEELNKLAYPPGKMEVEARLVRPASCASTASSESASTAAVLCS